MVWQRNGLSVSRFGDPDLVDPIPIEVRVDLLEVRQEFIRQFSIALVEVEVVSFEIVANIEDMISAEVLRLEEVRVLHQRKEGITGLFGDVVPVVALGRKRV